MRNADLPPACCSYISGGQAKNAPLVQLLADVCNVGVVLPHDGDTAVVLGAAMLGRFAHEVTRELQAKHAQDGKSVEVGEAVLKTQQDVERESERFGERLWHIMVRLVPPLPSYYHSILIDLCLIPILDFVGRCSLRCSLPSRKVAELNCQFCLALLHLNTQC